MVVAGSRVVAAGREERDGLESRERKHLGVSFESEGIGIEHRFRCGQLC